VDLTIILDIAIIIKKKNGENWQCATTCESDDDCNNGSCFYIDLRYCKSGEGDDPHCYFAEDAMYNCSGTCEFDSDCGDGGECLRTIQCTPNFPLMLQQENSEVGESSSKQQMTGAGLSSAQLGGIIGGCVGFVGILMIVVVIVKRFQQQKFNTETIDIALQVPLNQ